MLIDLLFHKIALHTSNKESFKNSMVFHAKTKEIIAKSIQTDDRFDQFSEIKIENQYNETEIELYVMNLLAEHQSIQLSQYFDDDLNMYIKLAFN